MKIIFICVLFVLLMVNAFGQNKNCAKQSQKDKYIYVFVIDSILQQEIKWIIKTDKKCRKVMSPQFAIMFSKCDKGLNASIYPVTFDYSNHQDFIGYFKCNKSVFYVLSRGIQQIPHLRKTKKINVGPTEILMPMSAIDDSYQFWYYLFTKDGVWLSDYSECPQ